MRASPDSSPERVKYVPTFYLLGGLTRGDEQDAYRGMKAAKKIKKGRGCLTTSASLKNMLALTSLQERART